MRLAKTLLTLGRLSNGVLKCDVIILQTFPFISLKPHHTIHTTAVRTCAKFQIVILNESEDREDGSLYSPILTSLI